MTAETLVLLVQIWGGIGALVALVFLVWGIDQIDEDAREAVAFRPLLIPGILILWPLVLWRWYVLATGQDRWELRHAPPRRIHLPVSILLAACVVVTLIVSFSIRQTWPADTPSVQLEPPAEAN